MIAMMKEDFLSKEELHFEDIHEGSDMAREGRCAEILN
jgi:hypothetical protein